MDIHYCYNRHNEINDFLKPNFEEIISKDYSIPITFSDEIPPIFFDKEGKFKGQDFDKYPIDKLMGVYIPETRNIVIYLQGINQTTKDLADKITVPNLFENLMTIVILHEIGHYWFHNVSIEKDVIIMKLDDDQILTETYFAPGINNPVIEEWIAQMFAFFCINMNVNLVKTMAGLSKDQPNEYQSYLKYNSLIINEFKKIVKAFQCVPSDYVKNLSCWTSEFSKMGIEMAIEKALDSVDLCNKCRKYIL